MPIYEYLCARCGNRFEEIVPSSSSPAPDCPECGAKRPERLISAPGAVGGRAGSGAPTCPAPGSGGCSAGSGFS
jgi:putative FmdB family regulatory protein